MTGLKNKKHHFYYQFYFITMIHIHVHVLNMNSIIVSIWLVCQTPGMERLHVRTQHHGVFLSKTHQLPILIPTKFNPNIQHDCNIVDLDVKPQRRGCFHEEYQGLTEQRVYQHLHFHLEATVYVLKRSEPPHGKANNLHMRKQRCRSASR